MHMYWYMDSASLTSLEFSTRTNACFRAGIQSRRVDMIRLAEPFREPTTAMHSMFLSQIAHLERELCPNLKRHELAYRTIYIATHPQSEKGIPAAASRSS